MAAQVNSKKRSCEDVRDGSGGGGGGKRQDGGRRLVTFSITDQGPWGDEKRQVDVELLLSERNSLFELMRIACDEWLNGARQGDGGVYDHMWKIRVYAA